MPSPFPGMDPFTETADLWRVLRPALLAEMRRQLSDWLPDPYVAKLVARGGRAGSPALRRSETFDADPEPWVIPLRRAPVDDHMILLCDRTQPGRVVTVIEVAGCDHKSAGESRNAYIATQREVLESDAHLVEIDLLREGERNLASWFLEQFVSELDPAPDYLVLISRSSRRASAGLGYRGYSWTLRERLPTITIPLKGEEEEVPLDLQAAFNVAWEHCRARQTIAYEWVPGPPLSEADDAWARAVGRTIAPPALGTKPRLFRGG
jgi:hypothetical protein